MNRRQFLMSIGAVAGTALVAPRVRGGQGSAGPSMRLFLAGDVMTGRGIDQILPSPGNPRLHEPRVQDAREYLALAEAVSGPIPRPANLAAATAPYVHDVAGKGRVLVYAFGSPTSGIPPAWAARQRRAGVSLLIDFSERAIREIAETIRRTRRPRDVVVLSIHWGPNWGYAVADDHRSFAHRLIDDAGVDLVHGHSSHHPKGVEVYRNLLILYGCGDLLNDYEGIGGYEEFRDDLALMYLADVDPGSGGLMRPELLPFKIREFSLNPPSDSEIGWLADRLGRECRRFGSDVARFRGPPQTPPRVER